MQRAALVTLRWLTAPPMIRQTRSTPSKSPCVDEHSRTISVLARERTLVPFGPGFLTGDHLSADLKSLSSLP